MKDETANVLRVLGINLLTATLAAALLDGNLKSRALQGGLVIGGALTLLSVGLAADGRGDNAGLALTRTGRSTVPLQ